LDWKIGFGAKKKLILGQKRINFGIVKYNALFFNYSKKWPFLASYGKIAIPQPKRIQIKKIDLVRINRG
jgi:hypothetical protein